MLVHLRVCARNTIMDHVCFFLLTYGTNGCRHQKSTLFRRRKRGRVKTPSRTIGPKKLFQIPEQERDIPPNLAMDVLCVLLYYNTDRTISILKVY